MSNNKPRTGFIFTKENTARGVRPDHWGYKGLQLTKAQVLEAMANSRSNEEAARWLGITYVTWKKYAKRYIDDESGKSLFEKHKNITGRGIPKNWVHGFWKKSLDEMLQINQKMGSKHIANLKELLLKDGRLGYQCHCCGYSEKRLADMKAPLVLNFKNGIRSDWRIENLQWICYNCYYIYIGDVFTSKVLTAIETKTIDQSVYRQEVQSRFEVEDWYYDHLRKLGLDGEGAIHFKSEESIPADDDDEFIDYKK